MLAMLGKLRGWDRTVPTPAIDWKRVTVDILIPAKNEERSIALALSSIFQQDFPFRSVVVFDDGSTDQTSSVVRRYRELTGKLPGTP
jgi:cellulose synthase/poly-beta-1,6-N-acetylglucosamine synthase-like glycosyltransferase